MAVDQFQALLAELVAHGSVDPDRVAALTPLERRRFQAVSEQAGLGMMRTLYYSWRLTKILTLLPFTTALLGEERIAPHLRRFWETRKPTSLYFVEECLDFLEYLEGHVEDPPRYFNEVSGFERARLGMRLELSRGHEPAPRRVSFRCNPSALFDALQAGTDLPDPAAEELALLGTLTPDGQEAWALLAPAGAAPPS